MPQVVDVLQDRLDDLRHLSPLGQDHVAEGDLRLAVSGDEDLDAVFVALILHEAVVQVYLGTSFMLFLFSMCWIGLLCFDATWAPAPERHVDRVVGVDLRLAW